MSFQFLQLFWKPLKVATCVLFLLSDRIQNILLISFFFSGWVEQSSWYFYKLIHYLLIIILVKKNFIFLYHLLKVTPKVFMKQLSKHKSSRDSKNKRETERDEKKVDVENRKCRQVTPNQPSSHLILKNFSITVSPTRGNTI